MNVCDTTTAGNECFKAAEVCGDIRANSLPPCETLHDGARTGNITCINDRLAKGDDVNQIINGTTAMYQIARAGFSGSTRRKKRETIDDLVTIFNLLADNEADFEKKSEEGCLVGIHCTRGGDSPLHEAIIRKKRCIFGGTDET